jgi:hypothetical protein
MAMQDLFQAMQMFKQGVQELQTSRVISGANEAVQQIKSSEMDEQQQRAELSSLANQMTMNLAQLGTPATTIQQIAGAIGPRRFSNPAEAAMEGAISGDQKLMDAAAQADLASQAGNIQQASNQQAWQTKENELNRQLQRDLKAMDMRQDQQGKQKEQKQADTDFGTNVKAALKGLNDLEKTIKEDGNFEFWNEKSKAKLEQAQYDLAIKYAKIVDPTSVAREGEVAAAQKYMLPLGFGTRNSLSLAAIKEFKNKIAETVKARAATKAEGNAPLPNSGASGSWDKSPVSKYIKK